VRNQTPPQCALVQGELKDQLLTLNLHRACCHLPDQCRQQGASGFLLECFVERRNHWHKKYTLYHATRAPALMAASVYQGLRSLELLAHQHPDWPAAAWPRAKQSGYVRDACDSHGVCMLGPLRPANRKEADDEVRPAAF
jgi:hypothetical protein